MFLTGDDNLIDLNAIAHEEGLRWWDDAYLLNFTKLRLEVDEAIFIWEVEHDAFQGRSAGKKGKAKGGDK